MDNLTQRFFKHVEKTEKCWNWLASGRGNGYGCFKFAGKVIDTHRFVWFLTYNKWPEKWILHKCDNKKCVNPEHLYEGTPRENYWDMRNGENAYISPKIYTARELAIKHREANRQWYIKVKNDPDQTKYLKWRKTQKYYKTIR